MAQASNIAGKIGENLRASLAMLPMSKQLTTIKCDVDLNIGVEELIPTPADIAKLRELFSTYEFRPWLEELPSDEHALELAVVAEKRYETIIDWPTFDQWLERIRQSGRLSLDTETTNQDYMQAELVGIAFATEAGHAAYVPLAHDYLGAPKQLPRDEVIARLKPLLEEAALIKIGQNPKYDKNVLKSYGVELNGIAFDTMLESYVLDSVGSRHDLDDLAERHLGLKTISFEDVAGKGAKQIDLQFRAGRTCHGIRGGGCRLLSSAA